MTVKSHGKPLTGRKVLAWFLGFFFIVFGANLVMSWFAVTTFSGVETEDAYQRGREFNREIAEAEMQKALGWTISVTTEQEADSNIFLAMTIRDVGGTALETMSVEGLMVRPVHDGIDQPVVLAYLGDGRYGARVTLPERGNWQLKASVQDAAGRERRIVHDISVRP